VSSRREPASRRDKNAHPAGESTADYVYLPSCLLQRRLAVSLQRVLSASTDASLEGSPQLNTDGL
jgi:hypothetical protein